MAVSDLGKVCLFSGISGVITLNGKPVANAKLVRTADRDGVRTDETTTDEKGYFSMPPVFERTVTKYLPQEFVVSQQINVIFNGEKYELWSAVKRKPEENTEALGKRLVVECELNNEVNHIAVDRSVFFTLCTWDVKPDDPLELDNLFEPGT